jgi:hypothetical protein
MTRPQTRALTRAKTRALTRALTRGASVGDKPSLLGEVVVLTHATDLVIASRHDNSFVLLMHQIARPTRAQVKNSVTLFEFYNDGISRLDYVRMTSNLTLGQYDATIRMRRNRLRARWDLCHGNQQNIALL